MSGDDREFVGHFLYFVDGLLDSQPLADFGVTEGAGGGVGDRLDAVSVLEPSAVSVLDEALVLGMAPEVVAVGEDGVVLGLDD